MPIYSSEFCAFFLVIRHEIYVYLWTPVLLYEKQQAFQFADLQKYKFPVMLSKKKNCGSQWLFRLKLWQVCIF